MAGLLGPSEDFDGLISTLEEMQDMKAACQEKQARQKSRGKPSKTKHLPER